MNSWSRTRKRIILAIVLFVAIVLVGVPVFFLFKTTPTCMDGVQNGDEVGVDCGGSCQRLCRIDSLPIVIEGDPRVLLVKAGPTTSTTTSTYVVAAVLENPNQDAQILRARYTLSLYDAGGVVAAKTVEGVVFVPRGGRFAIFEGPFNIDGALPSRALLEWDQNSLAWEKNAPPPPALVVEKTIFSRLESAPRLEAIISNPARVSMRNIDLTALIFDASGNIAAASKTFIDSLDPSEEKQAFFTWPAPFTFAPIEIEILTSVLP